VLIGRVHIMMTRQVVVETIGRRRRDDRQVVVVETDWPSSLIGRVLVMMTRQVVVVETDRPSSSR
jgi:hypothetical protein